MRYAVSVLLIGVLAFSFSACSVKESFILQDFEGAVSFETAGMTVKGILSYSAEGDVTFRVTEPENIKGVVFGKQEISLPDIKISYGKSGDYSPVKTLLEAVSDMGKRKILLPGEGEYEYTPEENTAGYRIIFDCEKDKIKRIETEKFIYNFE